RDHHDLDALGQRILLQRARDFPARLARHHHVEQHHVRPLAFRELECAVAVAGRRDLVAALAQTRAQHGHDLGVGVDDEEARRAILGHASRLRCADGNGQAWPLTRRRRAPIFATLPARRTWLWLAIVVVIGVAAAFALGDVRHLGDRLAGFSWSALVAAL